ncbi:MAG: hypothetical protein R2874_01700 [Desulfobacterales bacterium]
MPISGRRKWGDLYWIGLDPDLYDPLQASHKECHPLFFAAQLQPASLAVELVRTAGPVRLHSRSATDDQFRWLIRLVDAIFEQLGVMA